LATIKRLFWRLAVWIWSLLPVGANFMEANSTEPDDVALTPPASSMKNITRLLLA